MEANNKSLKSLILFGSSIFRPVKARDIDMLIVVDKINLQEKISLEIIITKALKNIIKKTLDITILDEDSLKENLEPGAFASGLIAGYKTLYDEIGLDEMIMKTAEKIAIGEYIIQKDGKRINLSAIAKVRLKLEK